MDGSRFDRWTKTMARGGSRRVVVRALAGGALAAGLGRLGRAAVAAACQKKGKPCDQDQDCCSKRCKHGTCLCSKAGKGCTNANDCCSSGGGAGTCSGATETCCRLPGEPCQQTNPCCVDGSRCEAPAGGGPKRCCLRQGESCAFDGGSEACCNGLICAADTQECEVPGAVYCLHVGQACQSDAHCCGSSACCSHNCCNSEQFCGAQKCCVMPYGDCEENFECCFGAGADAPAQCEAAPGGRKRCCFANGHLCDPASPNGGCCNGLVCKKKEGSTIDWCVELGVAA